MTNYAERKKERFQSHENLSSNTYNLVIGACLLYGFLVNALMVKFLSPLIMEMNIFALLIGYFVLCFAGIFISRSNNPAVSFIGYNLVVVPIGALLAVTLPAYSTTHILSAIVVTGAVVAVMMILATVFPNIFSRLGSTLFVALTVSLLAEVIAMLFGFSGGIFNWIFVVIFSLYIGYDWYRAQQFPCSLDNAIDCVLDLYLDIINLFLRILSLISRRD